MANKQTLFELQPGGESKAKHKSVDQKVEDRIKAAALRLAVRLTEEIELPARYKQSSKPSTKPRRIKKDAEIEERFQANVKCWEELIGIMLSKINNQQAWRFIDVAPEVIPEVQKLTDCKDFQDFIDYLILRRDKEECGTDELGNLAMLSVVFQRQIEEKRLKRKTSQQ